jgi:hypothetical protein
VTSLNYFKNYIVFDDLSIPILGCSFASNLKNNVIETYSWYLTFKTYTLLQKYFKNISNKDITIFYQDKKYILSMCNTYDISSSILETKQISITLYYQNLIIEDYHNTNLISIQFSNTGDITSMVETDGNEPYNLLDNPHKITYENLYKEDTIDTLYSKNIPNRTLFFD